MPWLPSPTRDADRLAGEHQLFAAARTCERSPPAPPSALGIADAEQARLGGLRVELARKLVGLVPRVRVRRDLLGSAKRRDLLAELRVLVGLVEGTHRPTYPAQASRRANGCHRVGRSLPQFRAGDSSLWRILHSSRAFRRVSFLQRCAGAYSP